MPDRIVPLERFREARRVLDGRVHHTPILASSTGARVLAASGIRVGDGRIHAKAEHLRITGAVNEMAALAAAERAAGVRTRSDIRPAVRSRGRATPSSCPRYTALQRRPSAHGSGP
jgi:phage baseplate assembly protein gpV